MILEAEPTGEDVNQIPGDSQVWLENRQAIYYPVVQVRLDMAGIDSYPKGEILQPLRDSSRLIFRWHLQTLVEGNYQGTIWLHILYVSKSGGDTLRQPLSAQVLEIEAVNVLGMSAHEARLVAALGMVLAAFIGLNIHIACKISILLS